MSLKKMVKSVAPEFVHPPAMAERWLEKARKSDQIQAGPFRGMRFVWEAWDENFTNPTPKFLGTYELELFPVMERVCKLAPALVIDVGAAEGFYAVGFATRMPHTRVVAFELIEKGMQMIGTVARLNNVENRVEARGACGVAELTEALRSAPPGEVFVMIDVEGFENVLMDPKTIPDLAHAHLLIEAHDCYVPGLSPELEKRFRETHNIERIDSRPRVLEDLSTVPPLLRSYARYVILGWTHERLFSMNWFYMTPKKLRAAR